MRLQLIIILLLSIVMFRANGADYLPERSALLKIYEDNKGVSYDSILSLSYYVLEKSNDDYAQALAHYHIGYVKQADNDLRAAAHFIEVIHILEKADTIDNWLEKATRVNLGVIYKQYGDVENAMRYYKEALPYAELYDNTLPYKNRFNALLLKFNIANGYSESFNPVAIDMYFEILEESKAKESPRWIAQINNQIGRLFQRAEQNDLAIKHYKAALENEFGLTDDKNGHLRKQLGYANQNLGDVYLLEGKYDKAEEYALKSMDYLKSACKFESLVTLTKIEIERGERDKARAYGERALELYPKVQKTEDKLMVFELMADLTTTEVEKPNEYLTVMLNEQKNMIEDQKVLAGVKDKENLYRVVDSYYREIEQDQRSTTYRAWIITGCALIIAVLAIISLYVMVMEKRKKQELANGVSEKEGEYKYY